MKNLFLSILVFGLFGFSSAFAEFEVGEKYLYVGEKTVTVKSKRGPISIFAPIKFDDEEYIVVVEKIGDNLYKTYEIIDGERFHSGLPTTRIAESEKGVFRKLREDKDYKEFYTIRDPIFLKL